MSNTNHSAESAPRGGRSDGTGLRIAAGVAVIVVGLALLTDTIDWFGSVSLGELWPAIVLAVGIGTLANAGEPRRRRQGLLLIFLSLWFFVNTLELGGLDWGDTWPLALVAVGASRLLVPAASRGRAWGALLVAVGLWLQASLVGLWGLELETSWPVALVLGGLWLVATSFGGRGSATREDDHDA